MTTAIDIVNITAKPVRIRRGAVAPYKLPAFFSSSGATEQYVQTITLTNETGSAGFKLTYNGVQGSTTFVQGSNTTAAAIQTALRTATGDTGLVVTGTTDTGPFTLTFARGFRPLSLVTVTSASHVNVVTLTSYSGTKTFKLTYNAIEGATVFTNGTNYTAAALQTALRTQTSDSGLIVQTSPFSTSGFTIVFAAGFTPLSNVTVTSGSSGATGATAAANLSGATVATSEHSAPVVVSVDLDTLSSGGRRDLQLLLSSGSLVVGKTTTLSVTAVAVTNISLARDARIGIGGGVGAKKLPMQTEETIDLTDLGQFGRRDLINLRAAGIVAYDTAATCSVVNISSKVVRIGPTMIAPKRTSGSYASSSHTFNLTTITPAQQRDLQHYLAAGQVLTHAA